ncbi:MAG: hypothetical protein FJY20_06445 [Bacteroidetes bacterium]|nr:hypothetical protein [Bacteroidota bacterium]
MPDGTVYILTGPVQSGKTTSLIQWAAKRTDVYGILTPVVSGKRVFMNAQSKEQFSMEADDGETATIPVGRFIFSKAGFDRAIQIIRAALNLPGWLVIDEAGPLELRGEGFYDALKEILQERKEKIILVVRKGLAEEVQRYFAFNATRLMNPGELFSLQ